MILEAISTQLLECMWLFWGTDCAPVKSCTASRLLAQVLETGVLVKDMGLATYKLYTLDQLFYSCVLQFPHLLNGSRNTVCLILL